MSKKVKVLVAVLAVVLLVIAGTATVMAKGKSVLATDTSNPALTSIAASKLGVGNVFDTTDNQTSKLLAKVATILGIPQANLTTAFQQAEQQLREALSSALDKAVQAGKLTADQAKAIKDWWAQRPDVINKGLLPRGFGMPGMNGFMRGFRGHMMPVPQPAAPSGT